MESFANLPPAVTLVLALLLLVWLVLLLLVPFMIESIRGSARKTYLELQALNEKLDRLITLLDARDRGATLQVQSPPADSRPRGEEEPPVDERPRERAERLRKEPTISG
jgi:hypothetical protein